MTRRTPFPLLLAALACVAPRSQVTQPDPADEQAIRRVEEQVVAATDHNDADALEPLLAPDWIFVNPAGILVDRARFLDWMRTGKLHLDSYSVDSVQVRVHGSAAVVIYRSTVAGSLRGTDISSHRRRTMMMVKREGRWQVVAQQSTPIVGG